MTAFEMFDRLTAENKLLVLAEIDRLLGDAK